MNLTTLQLGQMDYPVDIHFDVDYESATRWTPETMDITIHKVERLGCDITTLTDCMGLHEDFKEQVGLSYDKNYNH